MTARGMKGTVLFLLSIVIFSSVISGCAAIHTSIAKRHLDVQTKMSDPLFLSVPDHDQKKLFIRVRNTSARMLSIEGTLKEAFREKGFTLARRPKSAHYTIDVQILRIEKADPTSADRALARGFGGAIGGAVAGGVMGRVAGGHRLTTVLAGVGGLIGGLTGTVSNALVKDTTYMVITDVEVTERLPTEQASFKLTTNNAQGSSARVVQTFNKKTGRMHYRTRIVSTANKANLLYEDARLQLQEGLTLPLSGLL